MNKYERALMESRLESAQNEIRQQHNELESKKVFGRKNYFTYQNSKLINMINLFSTLAADNLKE